MNDSHRGMPYATLRLQLHAGYTLDDARADLSYFARLGVTHLYLSPVTQARAGSTHGYDVVDHSMVDPERGGESAFRRLAEEARRAGLGLLLDIVPNHMSTDPANSWWWDVLNRGPQSSKATWFDIDWETEALPGKVLAPFLAKPYDEAIAGGDIQLQHNNDLGLHLAVQGQPYPLSVESLAHLGVSQGISWGAADANRLQAIIAQHDPTEASGRERLHALLAQQHYQLAWWRDAAHAINWRRFFEVSELIGMRVEDEAVFDAVHALPLRFYAEGLIDGLRIDHVDGMAQPLAYCRTLRAAMAAVQNQRPAALRQAEPWVVVEKILAPGETLDERWAVSGTTGYEFAADVGALLHSAFGADPLRKAWADIAGDSRPPEAWLQQARQEMLDRHFIAERRALLRTLEKIGSVQAKWGLTPINGNRGQTPFNQTTLTPALDALLRHFPTYRSYVEGQARAGQDARWFRRAREAAEADLSAADDTQAAAILPWLDEHLGGKAPDSLLGRVALQRFQQLTPPLAAKSLEDTVFYRYGCLLSRNEVGSDPAVFDLSVEAFHHANQHRARWAPQGLLATATHDHKRGEDGRARLAVLSEIPQVWLQRAGGWLHDGAEYIPTGRQARAFHYMLLQTLVAAWPPALRSDDQQGTAELLQRAGEWAVKALREGKQLSSWFEPQVEHEQAWLDYLGALALGGTQHATLQQVEQLVNQLEPGAVMNSLVQTAMRMTCPGIPDLYQGTEWRDFSLVDPDNRRPVDYVARERSLTVFLQNAQHGLPAPFASQAWQDPQAWTDGRVKQALIATLLAVRKAYPAAFDGGYRPLPVDADMPSKVVAFTRNDEVVIVAGVKCAAQTAFDEHGMPTLPHDYWGAAAVHLPESRTSWRDILRARPMQAVDTKLPLAQVFSGLPLAVLVRDQG